MGKNAILEYRIILRPLIEEEGGGWYAEIPELPGCSSDGETREEALANLEDAKAAWIDTARSLNRDIPEPKKGIEQYSGKFTIRMPRGLHKDLAIESEQEGISLNQYVNYLLAERHVLNNMHGYLSGDTYEQGSIETITRQTQTWWRAVPRVTPAQLWKEGFFMRGERN